MTLEPGHPTPREPSPAGKMKSNLSPHSKKHMALRVNNKQTALGTCEPFNKVDDLTEERTHVGLTKAGLDNHATAI